MELKILTSENKETGKMKLPKQFSEPVRSDLIKRAVEVLQNNRRQVYGTNPGAGKVHSAVVRRRRRKFRGGYGRGMARTPRKVISRRGSQFNFVGAFAPNAVGGRRAHAPRAEKEFTQKINDKERRKAIRSALAAAVNKELVLERGHKAPDTYPFILDTKAEELTKTKDIQKALLSLGLTEELERASVKKVRAGKGKSRGRKYQRRKGPLLVVSKDCKLSKAAKNIPGLDIVEIKNINAELLAPGADAGRLTLFTKDALEKLEKENLFM